MSWLEQAKGIAEALGRATRENIDKALQPRDERIATLERQVAELKAGAEKHTEATNSGASFANSLERRASRHAEHLGRLEDRVRALETSGRAR